MTLRSIFIKALLVIFLIMMLIQQTSQADVPPGVTTNIPLETERLTTETHLLQQYPAPNMPSNPVPANQATDVLLNQALSWLGGDPDDDLVSYQVTLDTTSPPTMVLTTTTQTSLSNVGFITNTTYFWQVTASDGLSSTVGPIWQFTTVAQLETEHLLYLPLVLKAFDSSMLPTPSPTATEAGSATATPTPTPTATEGGETSTPTATPTATGETPTPTATATSDGNVVAFPGAEGFGAKATGGREGQVLKVTTLSADGAVEGSLQWALNQAGPRIIVFEVSGLIEGDVQIPHGDVTLAGQTAPGAGITILGHLYTPYGDDVNNIIIRHLRVRPPDPDSEWPFIQHDALQFSTAHTIILDHIDASHAADEIIDFWGGAHDITVQWSAITYPIYDEANGWTHPKGILNHRACIDDGNCDITDPLGGRISIHHNLFAHARNRTPALSTGPADVYNNVIYNGREGFVHHNIVGAADTDPAAVGEFNIVGNYYKDGPSISLAPFWFDPENSTTPIPTNYWLEDNYVDDPGVYEGRVDNPIGNSAFLAEYTIYCCGVEDGQFNQSGAFDFSGYSGYVPLTTLDATENYTQVLAESGTWPRDIVSSWAIEDTQTRTGEWGNRRPADWLAGLTPGTPPTDSDGDGMPDTWEDQNGLDSADGNDYNTVMPSGYTAIEAYINEVADSLVGN